MPRAFFTYWIGCPMGIRERKRISIPRRVGRGEKWGTARGLVRAHRKQLWLRGSQRSFCRTKRLLEIITSTEYPVSSKTSSLWCSSWFQYESMELGSGSRWPSRGSPKTWAQRHRALPDIGFKKKLRAHRGWAWAYSSPAWLNRMMGWEE